MRQINTCVFVLIVAAGAGCKGRSEPAPGAAAPPERESPAATAPAASATSAIDSGRDDRSDPPPAAAPAPASAFALDRPLQPADVEGRTLRELSLMRNTIFARAGHQFRKQWLRDYFEAQPWYHGVDPSQEREPSQQDRDNAKFIADHEAAIGADELNTRLVDVKARVGAGHGSPEDEVELRLISSRLGKWVGTDKDDAARTPLEDPAKLDRLITVNELANMSRRDLRILRNTIYARRGRPFKSVVLDQYFESMDWYTADAEYSDDRLTDVDRKNIRIVRSVEDSLGGPLGEHEHMESDGWFSGA